MESRPRDRQSPATTSGRLRLVSAATVPTGSPPQRGGFPPDHGSFAVHRCRIPARRQSVHRSDRCRRSHRSGRSRRTGVVADSQSRSKPPRAGAPSRCQRHTRSRRRRGRRRRSLPRSR
eukprot:2528195-Prymnesium_polylepis.2